MAAAFTAVPPASAAPAWKLQPLPNPGTKQHPAKKIALSGVSCPARNACTAVGSYYATSLKMTVTLAARWNGQKWSIEQAANPPESVGDVLSGVSCSSRTNCQTAGAINTGAGDKALPEGRSVSGWAYEPFPFIAEATSSFLTGVSCTTASACTAVGGYFNSSSDELPLAGRWNGAQWVQQSVPLPSGSVSAGLGGVSCASARRCVAVGGPSGPFAETWNGVVWTAVSTPVPHSLNPGELYGVSCWSSSDCMAVGDYVNDHDHTVALTQRWNGTAWKFEKVANAAGTAGGNLLGVSCPSARDCTAVGWYLRNGRQAPLAEAWNGKRWAIQPTPKPSASGVRFPQFDGVSCVKSICTAVGSYSNSADSPKGAFIERRS